MKNSIQTILSLAFLFFTQFATAQDFVWAKQMGGTNNDYAISIALDATGNVYTIGTFWETADFDPGIGTFNLTSAGSFDIFISKLDVAGNFVWAKRIGGVSQDYARSINIDALGNIYFTGSFEGTVDFDPNLGIFNLTSVGSRDIFVIKLDAAGDFVWAKQMGGAGSIEGFSLELDALGNIYTTGKFEGTVDFDPNSGTFNLTTTGNFAFFSDIFISKLDASGNFLWAKQMGGEYSDYSFSLELDALGNVYTIGTFSDTADFDPSTGVFNLISVGISFGMDDIFISKLDPDGNFVWAKQIEGSGAIFGVSLDIDAFGNIYTTGNYFGTADFDPGLGVVNLTSTGSYDLFISKLDAAGDFVWAKRIGDTGWESANFINIDASGNIYTTGFFEGTVDFDPNSGIFNLISAGSRDIFISKLDASGNFIWAIQMGGTSEDVGIRLTFDALGNLYISGYFTETADFDPGIGVVNLTSAGNHDIFISKLSNFTSGIEENSSNSDINIYPNPTKNQINFSLETNVQLTNITGQLIVEKNNVSMLDLSEHAAGLYFITLLDKKGKVIQRSKIIKE